MQDVGIMTVGEVCDYLRVSRAMVYRLLKEKRIASFKVGGDYRFTPEHIADFLKRNEQAAG